jgi:lipid A 3-O-deacylase
MRQIAAAFLVLIGSACSLEAEAAVMTGAVGATSQGGMTYRLGTEFAWDTAWFKSSTGHMTGYWDAGYTYWAAGDKGSSASSVSFAPVLVYEFSGDTVTPYVEAGIGIAGFSSTHAGEQDLGSSFNFEDRIGFGLKFGEGQKLGLRAIHYSNAGIKEPNDGIESFSVFYSHEL